MPPGTLRAVLLLAALGACAKAPFGLERASFSPLLGAQRTASGASFVITSHAVIGGLDAYLEARATLPPTIRDLDADAALAKRNLLPFVDPRGVVHEWTLGPPIDRVLPAEPVRRIAALPLRPGSAKTLRAAPPPGLTLRLYGDHALVADATDGDALDALAPALSHAVSTARVANGEARFAQTLGPGGREPALPHASFFDALPFRVRLSKGLAPFVNRIELREVYEPGRVRVVAELTPVASSPLAALLAAARALSPSAASTLPFRSESALLVSVDPARMEGAHPLFSADAGAGLARSLAALRTSWSGELACTAKVCLVGGARPVDLLRAIEPLRTRVLEQRFAREGLTLTRSDVACVPAGGTCLRLRVAWGSRDLAAEHARVLRGGLAYTSGSLSLLGDFIDTQAIGRAASLEAAPAFVKARALLPRGAFALVYRAASRGAAGAAASLAVTARGHLRFDLFMASGPAFLPEGARDQRVEWRLR